MPRDSDVQRLIRDHLGLPEDELAESWPYRFSDLYHRCEGVLELAYHEAAGWCCVVGDRHTYADSCAFVVGLAFCAEFGIEVGS